MWIWMVFFKIEFLEIGPTFIRANSPSPHDYINNISLHYCSFVTRRWSNIGKVKASTMVMFNVFFILEVFVNLFFLESLSFHDVKFVLWLCWKLNFLKFGYCVDQLFGKLPYVLWMMIKALRFKFLLFGPLSTI